MQSPFRSLVAAWLVIGCARNAPESAKVAPQPSSSSPATVVVSAAPVPEAAPSVARAPEARVSRDRIPALPPELLRELGAEGARKLEVAADVCAAAVKRGSDGKLEVGCRSCPPFGDAGLPDGKLVVDPGLRELEDFWELEALYPGAFTRAGATEAAAVFSGCEPHAANWGGTLLLEREDGFWIPRSYRSGFHPLRCETFARPDARSLLVCLWETDHQSSAHWMLDTYDFALGDDDDVEAGWTNLVTVDDDAIARCLDGRGGPSEVTTGSIESFKLDALASPPALRIDVRFARGTKSAAYLQKCAELQREMQKESDKRVDVGAALRPTKLRLVFAWNGSTFAPTAATKTLLGKLAP